MEHPEESGRGYPEEQPAEVTDDPQPPAEDKPQRSSGTSDAGDDNDDGTATGNPHAAGT
jgi:hypothetical protein